MKAWCRMGALMAFAYCYANGDQVHANDDDSVHVSPTIWFDVELKIGREIPLEHAEKLGGLPGRYQWHTVSKSGVARKIVKLQKQPVKVGVHHPVKFNLEEGPYRARNEKILLELQLKKEKVLFRYPVKFNLENTQDRARHEKILRNRSIVSRLDENSGESGGRDAASESFVEIAGVSSREKPSNWQLKLEEDMLRDKFVPAFIRENLVPRSYAESLTNNSPFRTRRKKKSVSRDTKLAGESRIQRKTAKGIKSTPR